MRSRQLTASRRCRMTGLCAISCGVIRRKLLAGAWVQGELVSSLVETLWPSSARPTMSGRLQEHTSSSWTAIERCLTIHLWPCGPHLIIATGVEMLLQSLSSTKTWIKTTNVSMLLRMSHVEFLLRSLLPSTSCEQPWLNTTTSTDKHNIQSMRRVRYTVSDSLNSMIIS